MEKLGSNRIVCSVAGCSQPAMEDSDPPTCAGHALEKRAEEDGGIGLHAGGELAKLWKEPDVHHKVHPA